MAEGFSRFYPRDFGRFVRIMKGSLSETIEHLTTARARGLIGEEEFKSLRITALRARGAARELARYLETADPPESGTKHGRRTENPRTKPRNRGTSEPRNLR
jgi:hypothetical protein